MHAPPSVTHTPPQLTRGDAQPHTPPAPQTPLPGAVHDPDVRGVALQVVLVPAHTIVPAD